MGELISWLQPLVNDAGSAIDFFGILVLAFSSAEAIIRFMQAELVERSNKNAKREDAKRVFVHKLIFGLDFLIAGDVLQSVFTPTVEKLLLLGGIVAIRSILSYSLLNELQRESKAKRP